MPPVVRLDEGDYEDACDDLGDDFEYRCLLLDGDLEFAGVDDVDLDTPGNQRVQSQTLHMHVEFSACVPKACDSESISLALKALSDPSSAAA